jgi:hypothetical protein
VPVAQKLKPAVLQARRSFGGQWEELQAKVGCLESLRWWRPPAGGQIWQGPACRRRIYILGGGGRAGESRCGWRVAMALWCNTRTGGREGGERTNEVGAGKTQVSRSRTPSRVSPNTCAWLPIANVRLRCPPSLRPVWRDYPTSPGRNACLRGNKHGLTIGESTLIRYPNY